MECLFKDRCKKYKEEKCSLLFGEICLKNFKISKLQDLALLTEAQRRHIDLRLDSDKSDLLAFQELSSIGKNIESFVREGKNLYIYSNNVGNGKSSWSLRLLNDYLESIWYKAPLECKGLFVNISKLFISLKDSFNQQNDYINHIKENIYKADLVVFDDVGTKGFTSFETENLFNIINFRLDSKKSNIYTSNLIGKDLEDAIGSRLYSRIFNSSKCIELVGKDKRGLL
jgi:DNA replication protein DnaC